MKRARAASGRVVTWEEPTLPLPAEDLTLTLVTWTPPAPPPAPPAEQPPLF